MILGSQIITKQSTVKKLDLEGGPSWVQAFLGGSCILGLGLVGVRFRVRISVSIWGRVRVSFVCVHLGVGLGFSCQLKLPGLFPSSSYYSFIHSFTVRGLSFHSITYTHQGHN